MTVALTNPMSVDSRLWREGFIYRADHFYCRLPSKSTYNVDILKLLSMSDYKSQVDFKQKKNQRRSDPPGGYRCGVFEVWS